MKENIPPDLLPSQIKKPVEPVKVKHYASKHASVLGIRPKLALSPSASRHAEIIDLISSDDDNAAAPRERKRSRGSSHSGTTSSRSRSIVDINGEGDEQQQEDWTGFRITQAFENPRTRIRSLAQPGAQRARKKRSPPASEQHVAKAIQYVSAVVVPRPLTHEDVENRRRFRTNLAILQGINVCNDIDNDSPPNDFQFITESVLGDGVERAPEDVMLGCQCQQKYSQPFGCVYLDYCTCIEDSAADETGKKSFPYGASEANYRCLRSQYLHSRNHIYECNARCDCTSRCKNRVVQHGRQVGVEIFKTRNRGWGLRCKEDLKQGQFIDTYRGEIITAAEANLRGESMTADQANYLFSFDKFKDTDVFDPSREYVCDGSKMGGPARFINHSCEPNCRIFTVSYNHSDRNIYELAFFAVEAIPANTELSIDYYDEEEPDIISDARADEIEQLKGYRPTKCLCGAQECRRYFFS